MHFVDCDFITESTPEAKRLRRELSGAVPADNGIGLRYPKNHPFAVLHGDYRGTINWSKQTAWSGQTDVEAINPESPWHGEKKKTQIVETV